MITHYRWPADLFAVHREHLFFRLSLNILQQLPTVNSFTHHIQTIIQGGILHDSCFCMKNMENVSNFAAATIINRRTRTNTSGQLSVGLQGTESDLNLGCLHPVACVRSRKWGFLFR
jgi:hypothetical protein